MNSNIYYIILAVFALFVNLPLGYMRAPCKKFSFKWFLYIHLSIPFLYLLRRHFGVGAGIIPVTITFAVIGQIIGAKIYRKRIYGKEGYEKETQE